MAAAGIMRETTTTTTTTHFYKLFQEIGNLFKEDKDGIRRINKIFTRSINSPQLIECINIFGKNYNEYFLRSVEMPYSISTDVERRSFTILTNRRLKKAFLLFVIHNISVFVVSLVDAVMVLKCLPKFLELLVMDALENEPSSLRAVSERLFAQLRLREQQDPKKSNRVAAAAAATTELKAITDEYYRIFWTQISHCLFGRITINDEGGKRDGRANGGGGSGDSGGDDGKDFLCAKLYLEMKGVVVVPLPPYAMPYTIKDARCLFVMDHTFGEHFLREIMDHYFKNEYGFTTMSEKRRCAEISSPPPADDPTLQKIYLQFLTQQMTIFNQAIIGNDDDADRYVDVKRVIKKGLPHFLRLKGNDALRTHRHSNRAFHETFFHLMNEHELNAIHTAVFDATAEAAATVKRMAASRAINIPGAPVKRYCRRQPINKVVPCLEF